MLAISRPRQLQDLRPKAYDIIRSNTLPESYVLTTLPSSTRDVVRRGLGVGKFLSHNISRFRSHSLIIKEYSFSCPLLQTLIAGTLT